MYQCLPFNFNKIPDSDEVQVDNQAALERKCVARITDLKRQLREHKSARAEQLRLDPVEVYDILCSMKFDIQSLRDEVSALRAENKCLRKEVEELKVRANTATSDNAQLGVVVKRVLNGDSSPSKSEINRLFTGCTVSNPASITWDGNNKRVHTVAWSSAGHRYWIAGTPLSNFAARWWAVTIRQCKSLSLGVIGCNRDVPEDSLTDPSVYGGPGKEFMPQDNVVAPWVVG